jgi:hypothetical protein
MVFEFSVLALLGVLVGAIGTLIGAGGGFILIPILMLCAPNTPEWQPLKNPATLTAFSLVVVVCNATSGSISYGRMKRIDFKSGLLFLIPGIPCALLGEWIGHHLSRAVFDPLFGVLLLSASLFLFFRPKRESNPAAKLKPGFHRTIIDAEGTRHDYAYNLPLAMLISAGVGLIANMLGIGGGIIHVPAMVHVLDFPVHLATATSHFVLAIMTLAGTIAHLAQGDLDGAVLTKALVVGAGAIAGAQIGAQVSQHVRGRWILRCLAVALGIVGVRILAMGLWALSPWAGHS